MDKDREKKEEERKKRLEKICKTVNSGNWGGANHDAVTFLGSGEVRQMERFHSGSIELDEALGGGFPEGRFIEIYGPMSSGKCLPADVYTFGQHGLMTVEEVFSKNGLFASSTTRTIEYSYPLMSDSGKLENTSHFHWNGKRPVFKIVTQKGLVLKATAKHPVRICKNGLVEWKDAGDIVVGDNVLVQGRMMVDPPENGMDEDDGALLGMIISEGHTQLSGNRISFTNENEGLLSEFKRICQEKFGVESFCEYRNGEGNTFDIHLNSREKIAKLVERYGISLCLSGDKEVPYCIRTAPLKVQLSFLRFYMMGDGGVEGGDRSSQVAFSSKSWKLLHQVQLMALNFGSFGVLSSKEVNGETYWLLNFYGEEARNWEDKVFPSTLMLRKTINHKCKEVTNHGIPDSQWMASSILLDCANSDRVLYKILGPVHAGKFCLTESRAKNLLKVSHKYVFGAAASFVIGYIRQWLENGWRTDKVVSVTKLEEVPTFDFTKNSHTLWTNGIVSHNSTITYHAIAEFQKKYPDEDVALIDVEFSLDQEYLRKLGVNLDLLIICQPESGDQALNVARALVQNGVKLIVVDSVAALVPAAELAGEIGDMGVGQQARLMSQTMRVLNTEAGKKGCTIIWTNQIRDKIAKMAWGKKTTTSGGRALGFYSSIRLEIVRTGSVKEKIGGVDVPVSNNVKVTITKNKTFSPYRVAEFVIAFGQGIDRLAGVFDRAIKCGVIEKRGAWYSSLGEQIGQGRLNAMDFLRTNPEFLDKIEEEVAKVKEADKEPTKTDKGVTRIPVVEDDSDKDDTEVEDV